MIGVVSDHFSFGIYDCGTAPKIQTTLIAGSIRVHYKSSKGLAYPLLIYSAQLTDSIGGFLCNPLPGEPETKILTPAPSSQRRVG